MARKRVDILYYPDHLHRSSWISRRHAKGITMAYLQRKIYKRTRLKKCRARIVRTHR